MAGKNDNYAKSRYESTSTDPGNNQQDQRPRRNSSVEMGDGTIGRHDVPPEMKSRKQQRTGPPPPVVRVLQPSILVQLFVSPLEGQRTDVTSVR